MTYENICRARDQNTQTHINKVAQGSYGYRQLWLKKDKDANKVIRQISNCEVLLAIS